jgi:hypothetical protein
VQSAAPIWHCWHRFLAALLNSARCEHCLSKAVPHPALPTNASQGIADAAEIVLPMRWAVLDSDTAAVDRRRILRIGSAEIGGLRREPLVVADSAAPCVCLQPQAVLETTFADTAGIGVAYGAGSAEFVVADGAASWVCHRQQLRERRAPSVQDGFVDAPEGGRPAPGRVDGESVGAASGLPRPSRCGGPPGPLDTRGAAKDMSASGSDGAKPRLARRPNAEWGRSPAVRGLPADETPAGTPAKRRALKARDGVPAF